MGDGQTTTYIKDLHSLGRSPKLLVFADGRQGSVGLSCLGHDESESNESALLLLAEELLVRHEVVETLTRRDILRHLDRHLLAVVCHEWPGVSRPIVLRAVELKNLAVVPIAGVILVQFDDEAALLAALAQIDRLRDFLADRSESLSRQRIAQQRWLSEELQQQS